MESARVWVGAGSAHFETMNANVEKPVLVLTAPSKTCARCDPRGLHLLAPLRRFDARLFLRSRPGAGGSVSVRIFVAAPSSLFPLKKLSPGRNNLPAYAAAKEVRGGVRPVPVQMWEG